MSQQVKVCETCDREMKYIPAGFSRTKNKPYTAFWTCDRRSGGCGATAHADGDAGQAQPTHRPQAASDDAVLAKLSDVERKIDALAASLDSLLGS